MDIHTIIEKHIIPQIHEPLWGHWYIKERIGSGSFSYVYRIEGRSAKGEIESRALKVSVATFSSDNLQEIEKQKSMILNEIDIMKKLQGCNNIVRYYDEDLEQFYINGKFAGYYSLIEMELVTPLDQDYSFSNHEDEVIKIAKQIATALEYAHKHGIIHRDVKPDNIFVSKDRIYKLGDFNVSKESKNGKSFAGAPWYMAPEIGLAQMPGGDYYTKQADIYSFGIFLYELLNDNLLPFEGENIDREKATSMRHDKRIVKKGLPPPRNASPEFSDIILKACAYDTKTRYKSISEILLDLNKLHQNKTIRERKKNDGYKTQYADDKDNGKSKTNSPNIGAIIVGLFISSGLITWAFFSCNKSETTGTIICDGYEYAVLYQKAHDDSAEIARLYPGEEIEIYGYNQKENWYQVKYGNLKGYLKSSNIAVNSAPITTPESSTAIPEQTETTTIVTTSTSNTTSSTTSMTRAYTTTSTSTTAVKLPTSEKIFIKPTNTNIDLGNYFYLDNGIFVVDANLFGKTESEIKRMFNINDNSGIESPPTSAIGYRRVLNLDNFTGFCIPTITAYDESDSRARELLAFYFNSGKLVEIQYFGSDYLTNPRNVIYAGRSRFGNDNDIIFVDNPDETSNQKFGYYIWELPQKDCLFKVYTDVGDWVRQSYMASSFISFDDLLTDPCEIYGYISTGGKNIVGFKSSYVVKHGKKEAFSEEYLPDNLYIEARKACWSYNIYWLYIYDYGNDKYLGWVDSKYIDIKEDLSPAYN